MATEFRNKLGDFVSRGLEKVDPQFCKRAMRQSLLKATRGEEGAGTSAVENGKRGEARKPGDSDGGRVTKMTAGREQRSEGAS